MFKNNNERIRHSDDPDTKITKKIEVEPGQGMAVEKKEERLPASEEDKVNPYSEKKE